MATAQPMSCSPSHSTGSNSQDSLDKPDAGMAHPHSHRQAAQSQSNTQWDDRLMHVIWQGQSVLLASSPDLAEAKRTVIRDLELPLEPAELGFYLSVRPPALAHPSSAQPQLQTQSRSEVKASAWALLPPLAPIEVRVRPRLATGTAPWDSPGNPTPRSSVPDLRSLHLQQQRQYYSHADSQQQQQDYTQQQQQNYNQQQSPQQQPYWPVPADVHGSALAHATAQAIDIESWRHGHAHGHARPYAPAQWHTTSQLYSHPPTHTHQYNVHAHIPPHPYESQASVLPSPPLSDTQSGSYGCASPQTAGAVHWQDANNLHPFGHPQVHATAFESPYPTGMMGTSHSVAPQPGPRPVAVIKHWSAMDLDRSSHSAGSGSASRPRSSSHMQSRPPSSEHVHDHSIDGNGTGEQAHDDPHSATISPFQKIGRQLGLDRPALPTRAFSLAPLQELQLRHDQHRQSQPLQQQEHARRHLAQEGILAPTPIRRAASHDDILNLSPQVMKRELAFEPTPLPMPVPTPTTKHSSATLAMTQPRRFGMTRYDSEPPVATRRSSSPRASGNGHLDHAVSRSAEARPLAHVSHPRFASVGNVRALSIDDVESSESDQEPQTRQPDDGDAEDGEGEDVHPQRLRRTRASTTLSAATRTGEPIKPLPTSVHTTRRAEPQQVQLLKRRKSKDQRTVRRLKSTPNGLRASSSPAASSSSLASSAISDASSFATYTTTPSSPAMSASPLRASSLDLDTPPAYCASLGLSQTSASGPQSSNTSMAAQTRRLPAYVRDQMPQHLLREVQSMMPLCARRPGTPMPFSDADPQAEGALGAAAVPPMPASPLLPRVHQLQASQGRRASRSQVV